MVTLAKNLNQLLQNPACGKTKNCAGEAIRSIICRISYSKVCDLDSQAPFKNIGITFE